MTMATLDTKMQVDYEKRNINTNRISRAAAIEVSKLSSWEMHNSVLQVTINGENFEMQLESNHAKSREFNTVSYVLEDNVVRTARIAETTTKATSLLYDKNISTYVGSQDTTLVTAETETENYFDLSAQSVNIFKMDASRQKVAVDIRGSREHDNTIKSSFGGGNLWGGKFEDTFITSYNAAATNVHFGFNSGNDEFVTKSEFDQVSFGCTIADISFVSKEADAFSVGLIDGSTMRIQGETDKNGLYKGASTFSFANGETYIYDAKTDSFAASSK